MPTIISIVYLGSYTVDNQVAAIGITIAFSAIGLVMKIGGYSRAALVLGFIIAIPLYICAYMKAHGSRWLAAVLTGVLMAAFCYIVFALILDMKLYQGEIIIHLGLGQG